MKSKSLLNLLVIRCFDIEECKAFYESIGMRFIAEQHGNGPAHYAADVEGLIFELYPRKEGEPQDRTRLGFLSDNITEKQILTDPDGRKVELTPSQ